MRLNVACQIFANGCRKQTYLNIRWVRSSDTTLGTDEKLRYWVPIEALLAFVWPSNRSVRLMPRTAMIVKSFPGYPIEALWTFNNLFGLAGNYRAGP